MERVDIYELTLKQTAYAGPVVQWHVPRGMPDITVDLVDDSLTYDVIKTDVHQLGYWDSEHRIEKKRLISVSPENRSILEEVLCKELSKTIADLKLSLSYWMDKSSYHEDVAYDNERKLFSAEYAIQCVSKASFWQRLKWLFTGVKI